MSCAGPAGRVKRCRSATPMRAGGEPCSVAIHAPLAGGDAAQGAMSGPDKTLRSTPPSRGATRSGFTPHPRSLRCDPRPPRGGRPKHRGVFFGRVVAIHAPLAGGDATVRLDRCTGIGVAIHAPLAGGDRDGRYPDRPRRCCDPRPPRGGRRDHRPQGPVPSCCDPRPPRGGRPRRSQGDPHPDGCDPRPPRGGRRRVRG